MKNAVVAALAVVCVLVTSGCGSSDTVDVTPVDQVAPADELSDVTAVQDSDLNGEVGPIVHPDIDSRTLPDLPGFEVADGTLSDIQDIGPVDICEPQCNGIECGDDGCGGECGTCPVAAPNCVDGLCQIQCEPDCDGKECGEDGCGGNCGDCPGAVPLCVEGLCQADCVADCDGKECGDDGCDGDCGTCPGAAPICVEGICQIECDPDCEGKECGGDGCDGLCGECLEGYGCIAGKCEADCEALCAGRECGAAGVVGECLCGECVDEDPCTDAECSEAGLCSFPDNTAACDDGNPCTADDACVEGICAGELLPPEQLADLACVCVNDADCDAVENGDVCDGTLVCVGAEEGLGACELDPQTVLDCEDGNPCTNDGCDAVDGCVNTPDNNNFCGDDDLCNGVETCLEGECTPGVELDCDDADKCTADACAPLTGCGHVAAAGICDDGLTCTADSCQDDVCSNVLAAYFCVLDGGCVPSGAENPENPCEKCAANLSTEAWTYVGDGVACGAGKVCHVGSCCDHAAACEGHECGSDGCGGNCGICGAGFVCDEGACIEIECVPNCLGRACGPDGCDGSCGDCENNEVCTVQGDCLCLPACAGKQCGADGCGGNCGVCQQGFACVQSLCECVPQCDGLECGPDLCGGDCGECGENEACNEGLCELVGGPSSCLGNCGAAAETCYCDDLCFLLGACCDDICDVCPELEHCTCGDDICDPEADETCDNCPQDCGCDCGEECNAGVCDSVACLEKECGDNGCGGSCGDCAAMNDLPCASASCVDFKCQTEVANFYCVIADSCVPSGTINPDNECEKCSPNDDKLGWSPVSNGIGCGAGLACYNGLCCNYDCDGKVCGDDGCGGTCGACEESQTCCAGACAECCDGNEVAGDGCYEGLISEFMVNPDDGDQHYLPDVATAPDGTTLICWTDIPAGEGNGPIVCRFYEANGVAAGYPSPVSVQRGYWADIAPLPGGGFVVVWYGPGTQDDIFGRVVGANGLPASNIFKVNTPTNGNDRAPHPAGLAGGSFAVVWDKGNSYQYLQRFLPDGTKDGGHSLLGYPAVIGDVNAFPGGETFLATWKESGIWKGRVYNADGSVNVPTYELTNKSPSDVAVLSDDLVAYIHTSGDPSYFTTNKAGEMVDEGGALKTFSETYNQPTAARLSSDSFVAVWYGWNYIYQRRVGPDGPIGIQERVDRLPGKKRTPSVAGYADGGYIVVWNLDVLNVCTNCRVYAQRFDSEGNRILH